MVVAKLKLTVVTLEKIYVDDDSTMSRHDRTGDHQSRVKMSQDLAAAINDGLYDYEDELWNPSDDDAWVRTSPPQNFDVLLSFYVSSVNQMFFFLLFHNTNFLHFSVKLQIYALMKCYLDKVYYTKCYFKEMYYTKRY